MGMMSRVYAGMPSSYRVSSRVFHVIHLHYTWLLFLELSAASTKATTTPPRRGKRNYLRGGWRHTRLPATVYLSMLDLRASRSSSFESPMHS
ncbi:hypothetical protein K432DRAFT_119014 [Lepidopterella palustris CBS 459.81]|uniref:Uncharacterized protein n=1 Tax=Lepidopterella palustris CBS 459.81 TaxID=1314670 RepID=A0A8E2JJD3_9PEZI|nr:hypothetical protein K432DRAFT_119014 [Lepidopterella palustris CBS 459.81]